MMKAIGINQYGSVDVLEQFNASMPSIDSNEILVQTEAFSINPIDIAVRNGQFKDSVILLFPTILGTDAVGKIVEVGSKVTDYKVGDEIIAHGIYGAYAEYFKVTPDKIGLKPKNYDIYEAAGISLSGVTAYNALIRLSHAQEGEKIVVFGAAGGVGSMLVQMSKAYGLHVIGIDASDEAEFSKNIGVDEFIDKDNKEKIDQIHDADIVIDAVGGGLKSNIGINLVKENGTYVSLTNVPQELYKSKHINVKVLLYNKEYVDSDAFAAMNLMIRNNQLKTRINKVVDFDLSEVKKAQQEIETSKVKGKIIVRI